MTDTEILVPMPPIEAKGVAVAPVNFWAQKEFLAQRLEEVLNMELTDIDRVKALKKGIVGWRRKFEAEAKEYEKAQFKAPMDVFRAGVAEVLSEIDAMEKKADEVLDKEEEKRIANINTILDGIIAGLGKELPDHWMYRIERKKQYYNKTADMAQVTEDLRKQYADLVYQYNEERTSIEAVRKACDDERLDVALYVGLLERMPLGQVLEKIASEKERLARLSVVVPDKVEGHKVEPETVKPKEVKPDNGMKHITLKLWYSPGKIEYLSRVVQNMRNNGINVSYVADSK